VTYRLYEAAKADSVFVHDLAQVFQWGVRTLLRNHSSINRGATIIQFVTKTLIGVIDWKLDAQQATSMVNFGAANSPTTGVGGEHPYIDSSNSGLNDPLLNGLRALGHTVSFAAQSSGVSTIVKTMSPSRGSNIYVGGADPRREGIALGDSPI
jgi:gamma-glutamyltranspeptidase/glutathione hydrolase